MLTLDDLKKGDVLLMTSSMLRLNQTIEVVVTGIDKKNNRLHTDIGPVPAGNLHMLIRKP